MNIKDFAEKFIKAEEEAIHEGKFDALEKLEDAKVVYHFMRSDTETVGWEAHKNIILGMRQRTPGIRVEWKYLTGEGNLFALSFKASGAKFTGTTPGSPPPTGKEVTSNSLFVLRVHKGKIAESWSNGTITGIT
jgi:predicted ester cyclase